MFMNAVNEKSVVNYGIDKDKYQKVFQVCCFLLVI